MRKYLEHIQLEKNCASIKIRLGNNCLGDESEKDVQDLTWDRITRKLPGRHGCGFYISFLYHEGVSGEDQIETHGWTK